MPDNSQVCRTMAFAGSVAIFIKGDIKHPVKVVFNRPMRPHHTLQPLRVIGIKAADEIACLFSDLVIGFPFGGDRDNAL